VLAGGELNADIERHTAVAGGQITAPQTGG
jgi:hypothetical protein